MSIKIERLCAEHFDAWLPLWEGYQTFLGDPMIADDITRNTFDRACGDDAAIGGFVAVDNNGKLIGMVMHVFHPSTFSRSDRCYLEDLFTAPEARGKGVARALIEAVEQDAVRGGASQVYWHTETDNYFGRMLYDKVAKLTNHIKYKVDLKS